MVMNWNNLLSEYSEHV